MLLVESGGKGERKDLINSVSKLPYSMNWLIGSIVVIPSIVSQDWKYHPLGTLWHSQGALTPLKAIGWYQTGFAWAKAESEKRSRCSCLTHSMHSSLQEKSALRTDTHYLLESQSSLSQKLSARLGQGFGKTLVTRPDFFQGQRQMARSKYKFGNEKLNIAWKTLNVKWRKNILKRHIFLWNRIIA